MNHKLLIVVDVQNDFIDGSLANPVAQERVGNIVAKIKDFKGDAILVTRDTHAENYLETNEGKKLPVIHCVKGTEGWYINKDVAAEFTDENGKVTKMPIYKDPKTDKDAGGGHFKKSQKGCCRVFATELTEGPVTRKVYHYEDGLDFDESMKNTEMKTVFKDGKMVNEVTLAEVRKTLNGGNF